MHLNVCRIEAKGCPTMLKGRVGTVLCLSSSLFAKTPEWDRARQLYQRTEYQQALDLLLPIDAKDPDNLKLIGQSYYGLGEYKKATETLEKAIEINPRNSDLYRLLGDTYGRRAETSSFLTAPGYASKARQSFEKAVELDPNNREATSDLFDYYLEAPSFLGGGIEKAEGLVKRIGRLDIPAGHHAQAQLDTKGKQYGAAEQELRHAVEAAPKQPGRWID